MALDDASQKFLAAMKERGAPPTHESTPDMARMTGPVFAGMSGRGPEVAEVQNLRLQTPSGDTFRLRVLKPEGEIRSVIVYFHGGGWVLSDINLQYDHVGRVLANATSSAVVLVNYRKAPEHRFPAAVEDCYQGLEWAAAQLDELAGRQVPLIVAGDSAGGNLAAVMTQWARDRGGPEIDFQVLVYPVTDADFERASYLAEDNQLILARPTMLWFWDHYLPDPQAREHPDACPIRGDLAGLPPAFILLAEHDVLRDEGAAYAAKLNAADVPTEVEVAEGQMHAFFQMINVLPGSAAGIARVATAVNGRVSQLSKGVPA